MRCPALTNWFWLTVLSLSSTLVAHRWQPVDVKELTWLTRVEGTPTRQRAVITTPTSRFEQRKFVRQREARRTDR